MKYICFSFLLLVPGIAVNAQNRNRFHHIIYQSEVNSGYLPLEYRVSNVTTPIAMCSPKLQALITLVGGVPVVDFFSILGPAQSPSINGLPCIDNNTVLGTTGTFILNLVRPTLGSPTRAIKVPFVARSFSVATVPFRYRFKTTSVASTVSTNLSASLSYGFTWGYSSITHRSMNNYSFTLGPFFGVSSADLKKSTVSEPATWITDRTNPALSYGVSLTLARNNLGLVISFGYDHALGTERHRWSYQDRPWIGVGINPSLGFF